MSVSSTDEELSTESVIDAIALIESQRQDLKREPDAEAWRKRALGTLEEILRRLEEAARLHGSSAERHANAQAVRNQIARVQARAVPGQRPAGETTRGRRRQKPPPPGNGARSMGRRSGR